MPARPSSFLVTLIVSVSALVILVAALLSVLADQQSLFVAP